MKGLKRFLTQSTVVVTAVGLVVALALSTLIKAFTTAIILPLVNRAQGNHPIGLGVQLGTAGNQSTFLNFGSLISAIIYFVIFLTVVYAAIVVPYRRMQARRGVSVFSDPAPTKSCPFCLSADLPPAATKCKYCASTLAATPGSSGAAVSGAPASPGR
jgi:large conductance mechanosensitive channel